MSLDQFIEKCSEAGSVESEGAFSVDSLAALRKTLASALPEPHYYLFQILQSLVGARAGSIKVAIGRRENRMTFTDPEGIFSDLASLESRFQKGLSVASPSLLDQMMSGLVTSLGCHVSSAELHYGRERLVVSVDGVKRAILAKEVTTPFVILRRSLEKGLTYSWSRIWGARKEEFRVRKSFEHSPIPLNIAGLPTVPRSNWRRGFEGDGHLALVEVAILSSKPNHCGENLDTLEALEGHPGFYSCRREPESEGTDTAVAPNLAMLCLDTDLNPVAGEISASQWNERKWTICFTNCGHAEAEFLMIRNGFSMVRESLPVSLPGVQIVGPADDLDVDASGYRLVHNEKLEARKEEARTLIDEIARQLSRKALEEALKRAGGDPEILSRDFSWLR